MEEAFIEPKKWPKPIPRIFELVTVFNGYRNREDPTNLAPGILVQGSFNVITNLSSRLSVREGYTQFGQSYSQNQGVRGSYDLLDVPTSIPERHIKTWGTNMELLWQGYDGNSAPVWNNIQTGTASPDWNFTNFWDGDNQRQFIIGVDGEHSIWTWNTALAGFDSDTSNTITKQGATSWAEEGFDVPATYTQSGLIFSAPINSVGVISVLATQPSNGGSGYVVGDILTITGGNGSGGTALVSSVYTGGVIASLTLLTPGQNYVVGTNLTTTGGTGTLATVAITSVTAVVTQSTITDNTGGFVNAGFMPFQTITITGTSGAMNDGTYTILFVNSNVITITPDFQFVNQTTSATITYLGYFKIGSTLYSYTGGTNTTTLTGVTPDPTLQTINVGDMIYQAPVVYNFTQMLNNPLDTSNTVSVSGSQLYVSGKNVNGVYGSAVNNFLDYSFTAGGRLAGEGFVVYFDATVTALVEQDGDVYGSAGKNEWGKIVFSQNNIVIGTLANGQQVTATTESVNIEKIKTANLTGAISQAAICPIKNNFAFLSYSKQGLLLGKTQFQNSVQTSFYTNDVATDLSYPVYYDFQQYKQDNASVFYDANREYIYYSFPAEGIVMIYNLSGTEQTQFWEAPQLLTVGRFANINGEIYFHGYDTPTTYKLFDGYNDDGGAIFACAKFSYMAYGRRANLKKSASMWIEGYISSNTILNVTTKFEQIGCGTSYTKTIKGNDAQIVCLGASLNPIGMWGQGQQGLGSVVPPYSNNQDLPPAFKVEKTFTPSNFWQQQFIFTSNGIDQRWELVAFGLRVAQSDADNVPIKQ